MSTGCPGAAVCLSLVVLLTNGCVSYAANRIQDLLDVATVGVEGFFSMGVKVQVGQLAVGWREASCYNNRRAVGAGLVGGDLRAYRVKEDLQGVSYKRHLRLSIRDDHRGKRTSPVEGIEPLFHPRSAQIEVASGLLFPILGPFSVRFGVNPAEAADFVLGFVGLDLLDDDVVGRSPRCQRARSFAVPCAISLAVA
ncbi:hypothetical protein ACFL59_15805, partial [Planctomycetota bacterium]